MSNRLSRESSPYLLQHQHNPVDWWPWGQEALDKAAAENKLIIVSIGYSACHWCHVMERESFENPRIAGVMNRHFVAVKVDREERPDIDQVYMIAVQLMTNSGGWPLNCICLPDGRPIYGGTYFRPDDWHGLLLQLQQMWETNPDAAYDYAAKLATGITQSERIPPLADRQTGPYQRSQTEAIVRPWRTKFDRTNGGLQRAPKFPMPNNWDFLLQYSVLENDRDLIDHVHFTLKKIASGGIYDHVGGGFARYSVDERWHVPHFEKMLYDNAQLVSLYLAAWQHRKDPQYLRTIKETLDWVSREMTSPDGGFYCALDADSEGVEGKYYTFTQDEIREALRQSENPSPEPGQGPAFTEQDIQAVLDYFNTSPQGNWVEEGTNVLYHAVDTDELTGPIRGLRLQDIKSRLLAYRSLRVRPGLDNKLLTSWNALMLKAFAEAYRMLGDQNYLDTALRNAAFIQAKLYTPAGGLLHQPADSNRAIPGFLDDYACCIDAFIALYEATFDEQWMMEAKRLSDYAIKHFQHPEEGVFYYTDDSTETIITRKAELMDNVMPSSNSTLLRCLQKLGSIFDLPHYGEIITQVLPRMIPQMQSYGSAYSNWAILLLHEIHGTNEIILSGKKAEEMRKTIDGHYIPNKIVLGGTESLLPILRGRLSEQTQAFLCKNRTCSLPLKNTSELLKQLNN